MFTLSPYLPSSSALSKSGLLKDVEKLIYSASQLSGNLSGPVIESVSSSLLLMNNYYSNEIESQGTHPIYIEKAQDSNLSQEPESKDKELLALAYAASQDTAYRSNKTCFFEQKAIQGLHKVFYSYPAFPDSFLDIHYKDGRFYKKLIPGEIRLSGEEVEVGCHLAIDSNEIERHLSMFKSHYEFHENDLSIHKFLKTAAAHHRFMHIHPFLDGNGRIGRLMTDAMLNQIDGLNYGLWSLSKGMAENIVQYKLSLTRADQIRQGSTDGRGLLTEKGLIEFLQFITRISQEQVSFMHSVLQLNGLEDRIKKYVKLSQEGLIDDAPRFPKETVRLILPLLVKGQLEKGEIHDILGCSDKKGRQVAKDLVKAGLLKEAGKFEPYKIHLTAHMTGYVFPGIAPISVATPSKDLGMRF